VKIWNETGFIPEKPPTLSTSSPQSARYILVRRAFKQKKIAIDNGWPVLYSGFAGGT
jgi:hypothetical protein